jgi:hypothetical protein
MTRLAPWPDFAGKPIHEGDTIRHPESGQEGRVVFLPGHQDPSDQWRVDYGNFEALSRLSLQIGEKGRAVVVQPRPPPPRNLCTCRSQDPVHGEWCPRTECKYTAGKTLVRAFGLMPAEVQAMFPAEKLRDGWPEGDLSDMRHLVMLSAPPGAQPPSGGA